MSMLLEFVTNNMVDHNKLSRQQKLSLLQNIEGLLSAYQDDNSVVDELPLSYEILVEYQQQLVSDTTLSDDEALNIIMDLVNGKVSISDYTEHELKRINTNIQSIHNYQYDDDLPNIRRGIEIELAQRAKQEQIKQIFVDKGFWEILIEAIPYTHNTEITNAKSELIKVMNKLHNYLHWSVSIVELAHFEKLIKQTYLYIPDSSTGMIDISMLDNPIRIDGITGKRFTKHDRALRDTSMFTQTLDMLARLEVESTKAWEAEKTLLKGEFTMLMIFMKYLNFGDYIQHFGTIKQILINDDLTFKDLYRFRFLLQKGQYFVPGTGLPAGFLLNLNGGKSQNYKHNLFAKYFSHYYQNVGKTPEQFAAEVSSTIGKFITIEDIETGLEQLIKIEEEFDGKES